VFPVEQWEGGISGIVTLDAIKAVPPEARLTTRVVDVAIPLPAVTVTVPEERLVDLMSRPPNGRLPYVLVFAAGELVGVVSAGDIQRVMSIASLRPPDVPPLPADRSDRTDDRH
jgi:CBS domain-containing protein